MAIFGDFMSPDTARLLGLDQPDAGGPADVTRGYDLTPPTPLGGGGGLGSLGALSNMLMSLGATSMMVDPTGQARNAGVAMVPFISRQIQQQTIADETAKLTNLVGQAEQQANGDARQMLQFLNESGFKATTPQAQAAMLGITKGLRDKVLAQQVEATDRAATARLFGESSGAQPIGQPEPANYVEQEPPMIQRMSEGRVLDTQQLIAKTYLDPTMSPAGKKSLLEMLAKYPSVVKDHDTATGETILRNPSTGEEIKRFAGTVRVEQAGRQQLLRTEGGRTTVSIPEGQVTTGLKPGESYGITGTDERGLPYERTLQERAPRLVLTDEEQKGFARMLTYVSPDALQKMLDSGDPDLVKFGQGLRNEAAAIGKRVAVQSEQGLLTSEARGITEPYILGKGPTAAAQILAAEDQRKADVAGMVRTADLQAELGLGGQVAAAKAAAELPGKVALAQATETARKEATRELTGEDVFQPTGFEVWDRRTKRPTMITNAQARDMSNWATSPTEGGNYVRVPSAEAQALKLTMTMDPQLDRAETLAKRLLSPNATTALLQGGKYALQNMAQNDADVREMHANLKLLAVETSRIIGGSARTPVTMLQMMEGALPTTRATLQVALRELNLIRSDMHNRFNAVLLSPMEKITGGETETGGSSVTTPYGTFKMGR